MKTPLMDKLKMRRTHSGLVTPKMLDEVLPRGSRARKDFDRAFGIQTGVIWRGMVCVYAHDVEWALAGLPTLD